MKTLNILTFAVAATALTSLGAAAQTTVIEEQRPAVIERHAPAVVVEPAPSTSVTTQERGGFLGTEQRSTTTTTGTGATGDCATRTVHDQNLVGERTVTRTDCP
jgi:D-alanyl-D-alanine carboxypeptidase